MKGRHHPLVAKHCFIILCCLFLVSCQSGEEARNKSTLVGHANAADSATINMLIRKAGDFAQVNLDSMDHYSQAGLQKAQALRYLPGIAYAIRSRANYERRIGNYPEAIKLILEAIKRFSDLKMTEEQISANLLLAEFYKEMGGEKNIPEYQVKGLDLARQCGQEAKQIGYFTGRINALNMQGIILRDMSKTSGRKELMDSAFFLYKEAIDLISTERKAEELSGKLFNNISQIYNEHYRDYDKAMEFQRKAVAFNEKKNNRISLTHNYNTIAEIYLNKGDALNADLYGHHMLDLCREIGAPFRTVNAYGVLSKINQKMGRFDSALYYYQMRVSLSDSLNNLQRSNQIANMQTLYETEVKDGKIRELDHQNQVRSQRLKAALAGAMVLLVFLIIVWRQMLRSRKQKLQIKQQSDKLQWMMKELHHRVKNNLQIISSLLNLQSYRIQDEEGAGAIRESQLRVQAMSLMHQRLYQVEDVSMVNFRLYLIDLAETLMQAYGYHSDAFDLRIEVEEEMMNVDLVMPLGLLVNEILTNSFKYAFKDVKRPELSLSLGRKEGDLRLYIRDNGPGFQKQEGSGRGFGQKLIAALSKQLKATYSLSTEKGTAYDFRIPYDKKAA